METKVTDSFCFSKFPKNQETRASPSSKVKTSPMPDLIKEVTEEVIRESPVKESVLPALPTTPLESKTSADKIEGHETHSVSVKSILQTMKVSDLKTKAGGTSYEIFQ